MFCFSSALGTSDCQRKSNCQQKCQIKVSIVTPMPLAKKKGGLYGKGWALSGPCVELV